MKKLLFCFSLILGFSLFLVSCTMENNQTRIRILSEDNTKESQEFKDIVKNKTLQLLKETVYLEELELCAYLEQELKNYFSDVLISVTFEDVTYPAKVLDGDVIPSGTYPTVLIKIEEGMGSNWWSILYPEFFGTSYESSDEVEYRSYFFDLFK